MEKVLNFSLFCPPLFRLPPKYTKGINTWYQRLGKNGGGGEK